MTSALEANQNNHQIDEEIETILTSFDTSYAWNYGNVKEGLATLYEKAKNEQWDGATQLAWDTDVDPERGILPEGANPLNGYAPFEKLDAKELLQGLAEPTKVTYHDSCHLKRGAGVWQEPRALLSNSGKEVVEMAHADRCCGFGGSYSFTSHPDIARRILEDKLKDIEATGADCVAMDCPGCLLQIRGGLEKQSEGIRAAHTIELLAETLAD